MEVENVFYHLHDVSLFDMVDSKTIVLQVMQSPWYNATCRSNKNRSNMWLSLLSVLSYQK